MTDIIIFLVLQLPVNLFLFLVLQLPVNLFLFFFLITCNVSAHAGKNESCSTLSCGDLHNIRCPFTLLNRGNPHNCSNPLELVCDADNSTIFSPLPSINLYVLDISYPDDSIFALIRIVDPGLHKDNCSSMPRFSLYSMSPWGADKIISGRNISLYSSDEGFYMNCSTRVDSPYYVDTSPCINASSFSNNTYSYVVGGSTGVTELKDSSSCRVWMTTGMNRRYDNSITHYSYFDFHNRMSDGFSIWVQAADVAGECKRPDYMEKFYIHCASITIQLSMFLAGRFVLGMPFVIAFMIYTYRRRRRAMDPGIEDYLHDYSNQMPIRYSYNDVKRMAKNFKEKLGQGGYGSVFKGIFSNNRSVAIKIMATTKGNGQEFINEVASIGRIHHVNIVRLIGFVAERSKRALVYEFMPNGSLETYIFPQEGNLTDPLSWMQMFEIALGITRGMDYLHRGCEMQILHFDIKPHNILLDENFNPKISDFGLAKLYSTGDSIVSMTVARGTMGYLAPELLYRNIGGVSYKSDVYSFGVMLLEMAGRRKNINAFAENTSQIYFPTWVYDRLNKRKDIEIEDLIDEKQKELAKKMIMVGLWCIQMKPIDRPSMLKVIEMLEGDLELLQLPPKPNVLPDEDGNAISID